MQNFVRNDSIFSDGWRGYRWANDYFIDHKVVNHTKEFVDQLTGTHINIIEGSWPEIKGGISYHHRNRKLIDLYILRLMIKGMKKRISFEFF